MPKVEKVEIEEVIEEAEVVDEEEIASQELVIAEERATTLQPQTYLPTPKEWEAITAIAVRMADTAFVPESYRGRPETVTAAILTGREMGIGPMQSLRDIHMIDGRPAFSAQLMLSKMRAGGVVILESKATAEGAWIKAKRSDSGEVGEFEFTKADAEAANLLGKRNWKQWPSDMFWARAVGRMARRFGSDLLGGLVYSKEELEDIDDYDGGYGTQGGEGYEATTEREIDPGRDLMPGAIAASTKEAVNELNEKMKAVNSYVDWSALVGLSVTAQFEVAKRSDLTEGQKNEWWLRLRNAVAKLETFEFDGEAAASPEEVKTAFAWAFPKFDGEIPMLEHPAESEKQESDEEPAPLGELTEEEQTKMEEAIEDVPFGDD